MAVLNLSPQRRARPGQPNVTLADAAATGAWIDLGGSLGELGDALESSDKARVDAVRATPDPWAQLRTFADGLLYPNPLTEGVRGQWRGLLALLAFADHRQADYQLSFSPIDLEASTSKFAQVMRKLLPKRALPDAAALWSRPVIVRLRADGADRPYAMLTPDCLIAAGRDMAELKVPAIPWLRNGLGDPTALVGKDALSLPELRMLQHFATTLADDLAELCAGQTENVVYMRLRDELLAYAAACLACHPRVAEIQGVQSAEAGGEGLPDLYKKLRRTVSIAIEPESSDCKVMLRGDLGMAPFRGMVMLDAGLTQTLGLDANRIQLWEECTLRDALASTARAADLREKLARAGYLLVQPGDFFAAAKTRLNIKDRDGHIASHPPGYTDCLLPLSPLALLLARPGDMAVDRDGYDTLKLVLASGSTHVVRRRFTAKPAAGEGRLLERIEWGYGDVALWPNFKSSAWKQYYARVAFEETRAERLHGRLALSGPGLSAMLTAGDAADALVSVVGPRRDADIRRWVNAAPFRPEADPLPPLGGRIHKDAGLTRFRGTAFDGVVVELQSASQPFEAMLFSVIPTAGEAAVPAGMAMIKLEETRIPAINAGTIAVDFGTTNTVACIDSTRPAGFAKRIVHPITSMTGTFIAGAENGLEKTFQDFFAPEARRLPTPSVVVDRLLDDAGRTALDNEPQAVADSLMFRDLIYFQPSPGAASALRNLNLGDWNRLLGRTRFNLKWSMDADVQRATKRYLRQFVMMLAAEAADRGLDPLKLTWRFSRPEAMSQGDDFYTSLCRLIPEALPGTDTKSIEPMRSEGLSAAAYILERPEDGNGRAFVRQDFNVILDIGGGTTDYAIWNKGDDAQPRRLLDQGSFRLAGGDFFTAHIVANPELLSELDLAQWANVLLGKGHGAPIDERSLRYVGELLFSGETLNESFERRWHEIHRGQAGERLKQTAAVFLGGIAWYIGRVARQLTDSGTVDPQILSYIAVALCGRGSGLFARIHGPNPDSDSLVSRLLTLISVAADHVSTPSIYVSPTPKIEVAAGMIAHPEEGRMPPPARPATATPRPTLQVAEPAATFTPPPGQVRDAKTLGIDDIDAFLTAFKDYAGFAIVLTEKQRRDLQTNALDLALRDRRNGYAANPPFIDAVKELIAMMITREPLRPQVDGTTRP